MKIACHFAKPLATCLLIGLMTGCVSNITPLDNGTENMKVTVSSVPTKGCQLIGLVKSTTENGRSLSYSTHTELQANEVNILQNQAAKLGGNILEITEHKTIYGKHTVAKENFRGAAKVNIIDWHIMSGTAYRCDAKTFAKIPLASTQQISDMNQIQK